MLKLYARDWSGMTNKGKGIEPKHSSTIDAFGDMRETDERVLSIAREAIDEGRRRVSRAVHSSMVETYWTIGREITEAVGERAAYGRHLISYLSERLTAEYGRGFGERTLRDARQFYRTFPIWHEVRAELGWTQYRRIMRVDSADAREFYASECAASNWSERELKRNIDTHLYERLLHTQEAKALEGVADAERAGMALDSLGGLKDAETEASLAAFKDPYVFEYLDIAPDRHVLETELESLLIDGLEDFLLELGRGFAFVRRQHRLSEDGEDWWIDLVFYNYFLRRFVLFELKTARLKVGDLAQVDFYLNFFDEKHRLPGDGPSIGILLCSEKNAAVARYSSLAGRENLYTAQYFTYLPTEEELEAVLMRNRADFEERVARALPAPDEGDVATDV